MTIPTPISIAKSRMAWANFARFLALSFLLSLICGAISLCSSNHSSSGGQMTAAAYKGPQRHPLPASSTPTSMRLSDVWRTCNDMLSNKRWKQLPQIYSTTQSIHTIYSRLSNTITEPCSSHCFFVGVFV